MEISTDGWISVYLINTAPRPDLHRYTSFPQRHDADDDR